MFSAKPQTRSMQEALVTDPSFMSDMMKKNMSGMLPQVRLHTCFVCLLLNYVSVWPFERVDAKMKKNMSGMLPQVRVKFWQLRCFAGRCLSVRHSHTPQPSKHYSWLCDREPPYSLMP